MKRELLIAGLFACAVAALIVLLRPHSVQTRPQSVPTEVKQTVADEPVKERPRAAPPNKQPLAFFSEPKDKPEPKDHPESEDESEKDSAPAERRAPERGGKRLTLQEAREIVVRLNRGQIVKSTTKEHHHRFELLDAAGKKQRVEVDFQGEVEIK